jgi:hypothetical protein
MGYVERFKKRKQLIKNIEKRNNFSIAADQEILKLFNNSKIDFDLINNIEHELNEKYDFNCDTDVSDEEADELLSILEKEFDTKKFDNLLKSCKKDILSSIIGPFGLGFLVAKLDKNGGNVTTNHNFEQGVTATKEDAVRYSEWMKSKSKFNRDPYDYDPKLNRYGEIVTNKNGEQVKVQFNSTKKKEIYNNKKDGDKIVDGYTGKTLGVKENNQIKKDAQIDLEHITSVKGIEVDSKNHLFAEGSNTEARQKDRVDLARNDNNLTLIEGSMNSSKGDKDLKLWAEKQNSKDPSKTNAEYYEIDPELINKEYKKSKKLIKHHQISRQFKKQGKEILTTGSKEGLKMGTQQALGLVLFEFFDAAFDELQDIYKNSFDNGFEDKTFFIIFKERLSRIAQRVAKKWKDACKAFADGFIFGFLSNLVTVIINMFIRTGKRVVRIIREGFFSLLKAIKLICFPPENMTPPQAAHEASKLVAAGIVIVGGIAIEQNIDNMIKTAPLLEPFADLLTTILIGGLTGLSTTFIVYAIDKIDVFKVNDNEKHEIILERLENKLENMFDEGEVLVEKLSFSL